MQLSQPGNSWIPSLVFLPNFWTCLWTHLPAFCLHQIPWVTFVLISPASPWLELTMFFCSWTSFRTRPWPTFLRTFSKLTTFDAPKPLCGQVRSFIVHLKKNSPSSPMLCYTFTLSHTYVPWLQVFFFIRLKCCWNYLLLWGILSLKNSFRLNTRISAINFTH